MSSQLRWNVVALLAIVVFAGCSRDKTSGVTAESASGVTTDTSDADVDRLDPEAASAQALLRQLADRDEALLEIARVAVTRREQLEVSEDARRILSDQRKESNRLLGMLKGEYRVTHRPSISEQDQQLVDLVKGSGVGEFDKIFLDAVTKHHEEDVRIIDKALPAIKHPRVRALLTEIRVQRASEGGEFRKRLGAASGN